MYYPGSTLDCAALIEAATSHDTRGSTTSHKHYLARVFIECLPTTPSQSQQDLNVTGAMSQVPKDRSRAARVARTALAKSIYGICWVICCPFLAWLSYDHSKMHSRRVVRRGEEADRRNCEPPQFRPRKRTLSVSMAVTTHQKRKRVSGSQGKSTLSTLPAEIRLLIFDYLVNQDTNVHIAFFGGRLISYCCLRSHAGEIDKSHELCSKAVYMEVRKSSRVTTIALKPSTCGVGVLAYLQCSRTM